jgi:DNA-directed RNA polymerase specialized sigma24 family protein
MTIRTRHGFLSDTRSVIALRGRDELGLSAAEIARQVDVNTSGITKAIGRVEQRYMYSKNKKESQVKE